MVIDFCKIRGKEEVPLVAKVKVQKTLSLHLADHIMNLRMQNNSTAPKDVLSGRTLEFPQHIQPYPLKSVRTPMSINLFIVQPESDGKWAPRVKTQIKLSVAKIWKENLSLGIISFGKVLVIS